MKNKKIIVNCLVKEIFNDRLIIVFANNEYTCFKKDITDYDTDLHKMFITKRSYKFALIKKNNKFFFSYKMYRPKLLRNRTEPIPTISGFKNVNKKMHEELKKYKFDD